MLLLILKKYSKKKFKMFCFFFEIFFYLKISKKKVFEIWKFWLWFLDTNPTFSKLQKLERAISARSSKCKIAWMAVSTLSRRQRIR